MESIEQNEDIDSSFELFEAIHSSDEPSVTPSVTPSVAPSMSIVAIPDESISANNNDVNVKLNNISQALQMSQIVVDCNTGDDLQTKRLESLATSKDENDEAVNDAMNDLKRSSSGSSNDSFASDLELYLKELRDENEKLKSALERNNSMMKQQLKNLHEWQTNMNASKEEQNKRSEETKGVIEKLRHDNERLTDRVRDLEGVAGLKFVEELGTEVASLRSQLDQTSRVQQINDDLELTNQELTEKLVKTQIQISSMSQEIVSLNNQLNEANAKLDSFPAMETQLQVYERDFKMEELAKLAAIREVEALETEIDRLKAIKTELEEKLERGQPVVDLKEPEATRQTYTCPKCWLSFTKHQAIQNHIQRCLDQDGLFT